MTLRLTEEETEALRQTAAREGRSMHEVARGAIVDYMDRTASRQLVDRALDDLLPRYENLIRRLADT